MIEKAKGLPADEVFLDLEDAVAPDAKAEARAQVAAALAEPGWAGQLRGVRVNDWTTPWTHADIIEVVSAAGASLDIVVLPKVTDVSHIHALDLLLSQLEATHGLPVGPDRHRGADRERPGADQHRRDRGRPACAGAGARSRRTWRPA